MTRRRRTLSRWLTPLALAMALLAGPASYPAWAQAPAAAPEGEAKEEGRTGDGYIVMLLLAGGALFVVAKSARR